MMRKFYMGKKKPWSIPQAKSYEAENEYLLGRVLRGEITDKERKQALDEFCKRIDAQNEMADWLGNEWPCLLIIVTVVAAGAFLSIIGINCLVEGH